MPEAWTLAAALGAPGGRGAVVAVLDSGVAYERHGALPARARPAPLHLRAALGLRRPRPPPERRVRPRHPRGRHDRPDHQQRHRRRRASPTARRSCRCGCSTRRGEGDSVAIARGHPLRRPPRRRRDQPRRSSSPPRCAPPRSPTCSARSATRTGAAWWSWPRPATRPTCAGGLPRARAARDRGRRHHRTTAARRLLEHRRRPRRRRPGRRRRRAERRQRRGTPRHCRPDELGRPIFQETFTGAASRSFGLPGGYEGTSMASPHVAGDRGAADRHQAARRAPDPAARSRRSIEATARDLGRTGLDSRYGCGPGGRRARPALPAVHGLA